MAPSHLTRLHPDWFLTYGDKKYFNPGLPEVWQHTNRVVYDIVSRYDIDDIHMDDYFYPYRIAGKEFPDEATYNKYARGLNKDDWSKDPVGTYRAIPSRVGPVCAVPGRAGPRRAVLSRVEPYRI